MTRVDLWTIYTTKNPTMAGPDDAHITMTARGLRKLFETTWEQAHDAGFANGKAWERAHPEVKPQAKDSTGGLFDELFGGKKP